MKQIMIKSDIIQGNMRTEILDHLGLVAATADKLGIIKHIDKLLPMTKGAKTTMGQRALAMILNGLGFINDRLYLFPKFLENKPVRRLFDADIKASDFNDDALGRFLDEVHSYGETSLYSKLALPIALKYGLVNKSVHLDTTTLTVYGEYNNSTDCISNSTLDSERLKLASDMQPEYGHAKNKRFDLKQMTLLLATTGASGFPIWMEPHSGNASDKNTLEEAAQRMQQFCKALQSSPSLLHVGDSAMYANCVKYGNNLLWLSRVPDNMNLSKSLLSKKDIDWVELSDDYKMYTIEQEYGGVKQRWILIHSKHAYSREIITLDKSIDREFNEISKTLWHVSNSLFGCEKDIDKQVRKLNRKLKYHYINYSIKSLAKYTTKGRPIKGTIPTKLEYKLSTVLIRNEDAITQARSTKGKFILATNQLDKNVLEDKEILSTYKQQSGTESGFKFIKDSAFEVDSIFLKKPGRISALMMVMTLCLMVYSYTQYFLRKQLAIHKDTITSQSGKQTNSPSMKWVYRLFNGIHVLNINVSDQIQQLVLNLNNFLRRIIIYFGKFACKIYDVQKLV